MSSFLQTPSSRCGLESSPTSEVVAIGNTIYFFKKTRPLEGRNIVILLPNVLALPCHDPYSSRNGLKTKRVNVPMDSSVSEILTTNLAVAMVPLSVVRLITMHATLFNVSSDRCFGLSSLPDCKNDTGHSSERHNSRFTPLHTKFVP